MFPILPGTSYTECCTQRDAPQSEKFLRISSWTFLFCTGMTDVATHCGVRFVKNLRVATLCVLNQVLPGGEVPQGKSFQKVRCYLG